MMRFIYLIASVAVFANGLAVPEESNPVLGFVLLVLAKLHDPAETQNDNT
jgi:hypothetical protein